MKIGVLDIQGSVEEHFDALKSLKVEPVLVKKPEDFKGIKGLIIPGGESTTIGKLIKWFDLKKQIIEYAKKGRPIWGTCAGAILLAKNITGKDQAESLKLMDITIERNAYGRQLDSFEAEIEFDGKIIPGIFIRAPKIVDVGKNVKVLTQYKGEIVAARENNFLVTNFHPELTEDLTVHKYFMEMCISYPLGRLQ